MRYDCISNVLLESVVLFKLDYFIDEKDAIMYMKRETPTISKARWKYVYRVIIYMYMYHNDFNVT